jgi:hypothetical protein
MTYQDIVAVTIKIYSLTALQCITNDVTVETNKFDKAKRTKTAERQ